MRTVARGQILQRFLGIDIGSSSVKAALFDLKGRQVAFVRRECQSTGEFAPQRWWEATREALSMLELEHVVAAGVCGRGGTNVLLGLSGEVLAPSWDDPRAGEEGRQLRDSPLREGIPQALALLAKARWWERRHGPVSTAFSAKDYVVFLLTGSIQSDPAAGGWRPGTPPRPLVEAKDPWSPAGATLAGVSALAAGIPVAVGWHDGAAATFGAGAAQEQTAAVTVATTAVYRVVTRTIPGPLRKYWDLTPGLTVTGGDILHAGLAWQRVSTMLPGADPRQARPGCDGVTFLPQVSGRIAPDVNRTARGGWLGISARTRDHDLLRAVAEGTAFSLRQVRDWLNGHGLQASRTVVTGGGAHSPFQAQVIADVLQEPIEVCTFEEGCRGAALLGAVAAGFIELEDARTADRAVTCFEPETALRDVYDQAYARFALRQEILDHDGDD